MFAEVPTITVPINEHMEGDGATVFRHACKLGLEGIVSKRKDSPYRSGRSPGWLKMKNANAPAVKREAEEDWGKRAMSGRFNSWEVATIRIGGRVFKDWETVMVRRSVIERTAATSCASATGATPAASSRSKTQPQGRG
jgi:hypothetical protein